MHKSSELGVRSSGAYETPSLDDYGTLADLTAGIGGHGAEDGLAKNLIHVGITASIVITP
jgi:hypothetical protein